MKYLLAIALSICISFQTLAHSGGTDKYGCHAGSQPYHCHNSKSNTSNSTDSNSSTKIETVRIIVISGIAIIGAFALGFAVGKMLNSNPYFNFEDLNIQSIEPTYDSNSNTFGLKLNTKF